MLVQFLKCGPELVDGRDVNGYTIYVNADAIEYIEPNGPKENAKGTVIYLKRASGESSRRGVRLHPQHLAEDQRGTRKVDHHPAGHGLNEVHGQGGLPGHVVAQDNHAG